MHPIYLRILRYWISLLVILLTGCTGTGKDHILPQTGPTMKQVYDQHFSGGPPLNSSTAETDPPQPENPAARAPNLRRAIRPIHNADLDLSGYTRETYNEIDNVFPRLTNPALVMYIYPHLSGSEGHPVPGYSTAFPLYQSVHYALPGEAAEPR